eukprot:TRINITY_DN111628_c0_g1_i1.p1 TRINITY_DN111628_c0_g1~~TRINITY_DN111628_c0_g1_i1.p1  ORF type:complete len:463 (+),score=52.21 TRINITY_DN111628_c0_g1_i1:235-1623(+)
MTSTTTMWTRLDAAAQPHARESAEEAFRFNQVPELGRFGYRHLVCTLMFLIVSICYADRTNIGIILAKDELPNVGKSKGGIMSAFFVGYIFTQIIAGMLSRRYGAKPALLLAVVVWTCFDLLTPVAAQAGFGWLFLDRISMGLGEGFMFPCQHAITNFWVPTEERAFLVAFMTSGQDLGTVFANLVSPRMLERGPACVFINWGSFAMLWALAFAVLGASAPELHSLCRKDGEAEGIQRRRSAADFNVVSRAFPDPFPKKLLSAPSVWAIIAGHVGANYSQYVAISWLPTFFKDQFNLVLADNVGLLAAPYLAAWLGGLIGGRLCDMAITAGFRTRHVRKSVQLGGVLLSAVAMQFAAIASSAGTAAFWVSLGLCFARVSSLGFWVNMVDIAPISAATVMGLSNTVATIPGIVGQPITQAILDSSGSWPLVFGVGSIVGLVGSIFFVAFGDDESLDDTSPDHA